MSKTDKAAKFFFNHNYEVLKAIYNNQVTVQGETFCPLSQEQIGQISDVNRVSVNAIVRELKKNGYLQKQRNSRKYTVTSKGQNLMDVLLNV